MLVTSCLTVFWDWSYDWLLLTGMLVFVACGYVHSLFKKTRGT